MPYAEQYASHDGGKNYYGMYPLKGKNINVYNHKDEKINNNKEFIAITKLLGLSRGTDYSIDENFKKLRYGRGIIIMADADVDIYINKQCRGG